MNEELEAKLCSTAAGSQWKKIGVYPHHGVCIPLFSLHSEKSCGIGEYLDLIPMIDWCHEIGLDVIQLLPLNDTGLGTSPYSALSAYALNPIHLSLNDLPEIDTLAYAREKLAKIHYWTGTERVKYHIVRELKFAFLREYASLHFPQIAESAAYKIFFEANQKWLEPYSLFKAIKEVELWKPWEEWPTQSKSPTEEHYKALLSHHAEACQFHQIIQFFCFQQFERVKEHADKKGVFLKGDIPILIGRDSADVWHCRHFFLLDHAAGAPPDMYSRTGQYWGFPLYDWVELEKERFTWWRERLELATRLYHLYRIDHVVGFFRMWAIPLGKQAKEGAFIPSDPSTWIPQGEKLMRMMIESAPILPIGEDLGLVPTEVKQCLYDLGICGTKVLRWEQDFDGDGSFIDPTTYPPMTMTTVSTHDSDTLQLWWRHFPKEAKLYCKFKGWNYLPFLDLPRQKAILHDAHHSSSLFHINLLQEYLALFPELVAKNPNDERINVPGKILDTNWTYRFRPSVKEIAQHAPLRQLMREMIQ